MAQCFPDRPPAGAPDSEWAVFAALTRLPDPWRVFHSVAWQSAAGGKAADGEADFVLLHPGHGLIILEVIGGSVRVEGGRWFSFNSEGRHPIKDPYQQATASKHALVAYLRQRARRLAVDGFRVLLTCFNRPLGDHLSGSFAGVDAVSAYSFHALCRLQIGSAGLPFPQDPPKDWWEGPIVDLLMAAVERTEFDIDPIVVDEGQDFPPTWFTALQALMGDPDQGPTYVFADSHQAIYRTDWEPPFDAEPFELSINCRNTHPVAKLVANVFRDTVQDRGVGGPEPDLLPVESHEGAIKAVRGVLHGWLNEGRLAEGQVTVLAQQRGLVDRLRASELAGHRLTALGGGGVTCETIHRFKGLEADGVVVILDALTSDQDRMLAYVGLSRAKSLLAVIGPNDVVAAVGGA